MFCTISIIAHTIWAWLPEITVGLQFATALIRFYQTATLMIRHRDRIPGPPDRWAPCPDR